MTRQRRAGRAGWRAALCGLQVAWDGSVADGPAPLLLPRRCRHNATTRAAAVHCRSPRRHVGLAVRFVCLRYLSSGVCGFGSNLRAAHLPLRAQRAATGRRPFTALRAASACLRLANTTPSPARRWRAASVRYCCACYFPFRRHLPAHDLCGTTYPPYTTPYANCCTTPPACLQLPSLPLLAAFVLAPAAGAGAGFGTRTPYAASVLRKHFATTQGLA